VKNFVTLAEKTADPVESFRPWAMILSRFAATATAGPL
jgi:hypothetical protein